jgi:serine/threonine protein kinase
MTPHEKLVYGSYEVLKNEDGSLCVLGEGSFGVTYKARHVFLGRISALKVIREELLNRGNKDSHEESSRFLNEARAVGRLSHPGIAIIHDCAIDQGIFYYAMEFCDGGTLQEWCDTKGPMPWPEVRQIAIQVASALDYAHAIGFLHRDLKPANIMLTGEGAARQIKLIDFGLAIKLNTAIESSSATVRVDEQVFRGNFATASPEQILEQPLDHRSDLFSLGVTLWWLLLGKNPFADMKRGPLIADRVGPSSYVSSLPLDLDPEARELLEGLLEKDAGKRTASAREVVQRLSGPGLGAAASAALPPLVAFDEPPALEPLPAPSDLEADYDLGGLVAAGSQIKLYSAIHKATGEEVVALVPEPSLDPDALGGLRFAASCQLDFGAYAMLDWRNSGVDVFLISKPDGCSLLSVLRKFGPARFADALPFLSHLARCCDASIAWTSFGIRMEPGEIQVRARDGSSDVERLHSWSDIDPHATRCLPLFGSDSENAMASEATLSSSSAREFPPLAQFAALIYRILAGTAVRYAAFFTSNGYVMASGLSEDGNHLLADTICAPSTQPSACRFLQLLAGLESLPIEELSPLTHPPSEEEIAIGKMEPSQSPDALDKILTRGPLLPKPEAPSDNSVSIHDKVAELERELAIAKHAAELEARRLEEERLEEQRQEAQRLIEEAKRQAAEKVRLEAEMRQRAEEARVAAEEARRAAEAAAEAQRIQEEKRRAAEEEARRRAELERQAEETRRAAQAAAVAAAQAAAEAKRKEAEAAAKLAEERKREEERRAVEEARLKEEEATRKAAEEEKQRLVEEARVAEEARQKNEEAARKAAEEEKRRLEEQARAETEARRKEEQERKRKEEEEKKQAEIQRKAAESDAVKRRKEEEAKRKAAEEAARKEAETQRKKEAEEEKKRAEEARRAAELQRKEDSARKLAEEKNRKDAEAEAKRLEKEKALPETEQEPARKEHRQSPAVLKRREEEAQRKATQDAVGPPGEIPAPPAVDSPVQVSVAPPSPEVVAPKRSTSNSYTGDRPRGASGKKSLAIAASVVLLLSGAFAAYKMTRGEKPAPESKPPKDLATNPTPAVVVPAPASPEQANPVPVAEDPPAPLPPASIALEINKTHGEGNGTKCSSIQLQELVDGSPSGKILSHEDSIDGVEAKPGSIWRVSLRGPLRGDASESERPLAQVDLLLPGELKSGEVVPIKIEVPAELPVVTVRNPFDRTDYSVIKVKPGSPHGGTSPVKVTLGKSMAILSGQFSPTGELLKERERKTGGKTNEWKFPIAGSSAWTVTLTGSRLADKVEVLPDSGERKVTFPQPVSGRYRRIETLLPDFPFKKARKGKVEFERIDELPGPTVDGSPPVIPYYHRIFHPMSEEIEKTLNELGLGPIIAAGELHHFVGAEINFDLTKTTGSVGDAYVVIFCPHINFIHFRGGLEVSGNRVEDLRFTLSQPAYGSVADEGKGKGPLGDWAPEYLRKARAGSGKDVEVLVVDEITGWLDSFHNDRAHAEFPEWKTITTLNTVSFQFQADTAQGRVAGTIMTLQKPEYGNGFDQRGDAPPAVSIILLDQK